METITEHEDNFWKTFKPIDNTAQPCGIACDECGTELLADYSICLTSNPPQTPVYCPKCGWRGSIH